MKLKKIIASVLASLMLAMPIVSFAELSDEYITYDNILNFIEKSYIDDTVTKDKLLETALSNYLKDNPQHLVDFLKATFDGLDQYSQFFTMEEFQSFVDNVNSVMYGIGVIIENKAGYITIASCVEDGGAAKAGVQVGDKIIRVNGTDVVGMSIDAVRALIVGERYTDVTVTFLRGDREVEYTITRDAVKNNTVNYSILKDKIGYIKITTFAETTAAEFSDALAAMDKEGITNIIMDLRNNPGGLTDSAIDIAKMIVPKGVIITLEHRQEEKSKVYTSDLENPKYKFAVLINENTASSSEILASAMSESGVATLIGDTTYGKAVAQEAFVVADAYGGIKLTTAHYLTRNGNAIDGKGIDPDMVVLNVRRPVDNSKYTQFDYKQKCQVGDTAQNVRAAEERLNLMGYNVGEVDDVFTEETENAIKRFQEDKGLFVYGVLDITTQVSINNTFYNMQEYVDKQFDAAYEFFGGKIKE